MSGVLILVGKVAVAGKIGKGLLVALLGEALV